VRFQAQAQPAQQEINLTPIDVVSIVRLILHGLFGGAFLYAGIVKALEPTQFLDDIRSFELLLDPYAGIMALFIPYLEIIAGIAVVGGPFRKGGLGLLVASLLIFLGAILSAWLRGIDIRCGCFGNQENTASNYLELITRDLLLLALGCWLLRLQFRQSKITFISS